jgi:hypothetical protein
MRRDLRARLGLSDGSRPLGGPSRPTLTPAWPQREGCCCASASPLAAPAPTSPARWASPAPAPTAGGPATASTARPACTTGPAPPTPIPGACPPASRPRSPGSAGSASSARHGSRIPVAVAPRQEASRPAQGGRGNADPGLTEDNSFEKWVRDCRFGRVSKARKGGAIIVFDFEGAAIKRYLLVNPRLKGPRSLLKMPGPVRTGVLR